ncbi:MAG: CoA pyrophosphatase [Acidobacteria bacterium]|nr:CoA pyrophosphatase [Acidobacteriota bacterium]
MFVTLTRVNPLDLVADRLRAALQLPLPGVDAQLRLAPRPRAGWDPHRLPDGLRDAAALILLYPRHDAPHLLLTVRGGHLRHHTGQVSLPGGAVDPGETIEAAALREALEEVGVDPRGVDVLGRLTPLHVPVSGFLLHPVIGVAARRPHFTPAPDEVARLLEVPLRDLLDHTRVRTERQVRERAGRLVEMDVPFFDVADEKVWGATAMVLAEFAALLAADAD